LSGESPCLPVLRYSGFVDTSDRQETERHYPGRAARRAVILAFGVLLALLVTAGWKAIAALGEIHAREQAARLDFLSRTEPLVQIHIKLSLYGDLIQKSVSLAGAQTSSQEARALFSQIRTELDRYPHGRRPEEQSLIDRLQTTLAEQDRVRAIMLALDDSAQMQRTLGTEVLPSHLRVIAATEQIAFWNDNRFRSVNSDLRAEFNQLRSRLKLLLVVLLGSGLAISLGSIVLLTAQEKEIRFRYDELAKNHAAQEQLSARLLNAQEQERLSISRELHDEVGQSLGALLVDMGRLSAIVPSDDSAVQDAIHRVRSLAETSVAAVRNIALLLRPSMLDDLGLVAAIEWQAREVSRRSEVEVEVQAEEITRDLREDLKMCIYRITQEALNNVARHSGARHARVSIQSDDTGITVAIRDDGHGFDPQHSRGLGILGMEERVRLVHGTFRVESTLGTVPGKGTEIIARLPLV
jgi:signal transduction histidine kinase